MFSLNFTRRQWLTLIVIGLADFCNAICISLQAPFFPQEVSKRLERKQNKLLKTTCYLIAGREEGRHRNRIRFSVWHLRAGRFSHFAILRSISESHRTQSIIQRRNLHHRHGGHLLWTAGPNCGRFHSTVQLFFLLVIKITFKFNFFILFTLPNTHRAGSQSLYHIGDYHSRYRGDGQRRLHDGFVCDYRQGVSG